jgi:hypothetical protein
MAGIPTTCLLKTFQDAIAITRQLSVSYIWIDSMCIFQDNPDDWHKEAASMFEVYSHSLCNIAATGAPDGSTGLFFERDSTAECSFQVTTEWSLHVGKRNFNYPTGAYQVFPIDHWRNDLEMGPLNRRAWVMQERFLSTRVLHFARSQLFWECKEISSSELFPEAIHPQAQPIWFVDGQRRLKKISAQTQRDLKWKEQMYLGWQAFSKAYTRCGLTKDNDKLVAINGVQEMVSRLTGDVFIAGLWRSRIIRELCWFRYSGQEAPAKTFPEKWRAPSWSWASNNVEIHPGTIRHHISCSDFRYRATVEEMDIDARDSGELNRATLTIRGKLFHGSFTYKMIEPRDNTLLRITAAVTDSTQESSNNEMLDLTLDNENSELDGEELVCIAAYACKCAKFVFMGKESTYRSLEALVLKAQNANPKQYERVGLLRAYESFYDFYIANETDIEHNIMLV